MWWIPLAMMAAGSFLKAEGYKEEGKAARIAGERRNVAAQFEAEQLEQQAVQVFAASQRDAAEEDRRARLVQSRALAVAAASGAGASDPTVVKVISQVAGEGAYRRQVALYRGEDSARRLRLAAAAKRYEGASAEISGYYGQKTANLAGFGSLLSGAGQTTLAGKYGGGGGDGGGLE